MNIKFKYKGFKSKEFLVFLIFLFSFSLLSIFLDWHYDESWTFRDIKENSLIDLLTYNKFKYANNHLFNSLLFRICQVLEVKQMIFYRLLSLIGFCLYYYGVLKLLKYFELPFYNVFFFLITPFFFYFSLGRGYGLALGSFVLSFYYLISVFHEKRIKSEYLFLLFGVISSLSIFSFIYIFIASLIVYGIYKLKTGINIHLFIIGLISIITVFYIYFLGKIVNDFDTYTPSSNSFIKDGTLSSIISDLTYFSFFKEYSFYAYIKYGFIVLCILPFIKYKLIIKAGLLDKKYFLPVLLIAVSFLLMIIAHMVTTAKYPLNRAIYFIHFLIFLTIIILFNKGKILLIIPLIYTTLIATFIIGIEINDLRYPKKYELIKQSGYSNLYILSHDPTFYVTNEFYKVNKKNIFMSRYPEDLIKLINSDISKNKYIISNSKDVERFKFRKKLIQKGRMGINLYCLF